MTILYLEAFLFCAWPALHAIAAVLLLRKKIKRPRLFLGASTASFYVLYLLCFSLSFEGTGTSGGYFLESGGSQVRSAQPEGWLATSFLAAYLWQMLVFSVLAFVLLAIFFKLSARSNERSAERSDPN